MNVHLVLNLRMFCVTLLSLCATLKRVVWYFEEGDVVLLRGWCGTLKRVMWYFEEGGVLLRRR